jgi:hypothetical protein
MTKLSKQFEVLVARMKDYELYHVNDDIHHELTCLKDMIDEVEKRMFCIGKINKEIYDSSQFTNDEIKISSIDITIALDLNDDEPITENWYDLFSVRAFKVTSDIHNSVSNKIFDVLHISLNEKGERMGELNVRDPEDETRNLIVNLDLEGICLSEGEMQVAKYEEYKHEIKECLYRLFNSMSMDLPTNFDEILDFVISDVEETADRNWSDGDVASGFRRWIESK